MIELLAPAGNLEKAKIAVLYGADAVYVGGQRFSLRSRASNFSLEEIAELAEFAHAHGSHVHVTVNILPHEGDLDGLKEYLLALDEAGIDAIIAASPAILKLAKDLNVGYECHVSTQHSSTNMLAVRFWKEQGMDRVVLGRECTLEDIEQIAKEDLPVEVFIHGGMCISYSGRCVLSNHLTLRDANRGGCAQSCRWQYHVMDGEEELSDPACLFSMSSKDLQAVDWIEPLMKAGVASLKIEGRMKSAYYLATVISAYRHLIDAIEEKGYASPEDLAKARSEIAKAENRPTGPGFYKGLPGPEVQLFARHDENVTQEFVALVLEAGEGKMKFQTKNKFLAGDALEIFGPHLGSQPIALFDIQDEEGNPVEVLNQPMKVFTARYEGAAEPQAMIRKIRTNDA